MGRRVEGQIRWDWDLNPGLFSLHFASEVNASQGIAFRKAVQKLEDGDRNPQDDAVGTAMRKKRRPEKGDFTHMVKTPRLGKAYVRT